MKLRTALKNKVNNLCSAQGSNLNKETLSSEKGLRRVLEMRFEAAGESGAEDHHRADSQSEREHCRAGADHRQGRPEAGGHTNLTSIKGIGGLAPASCCR